MRRKKLPVKLPAFVQGHHHGVPVVLLHGLGESWRTFEMVLLHLPNSLRAHAVTLRGHGEARGPAGGPADMAADVVAYLDAQLIDEAVLVGHAAGARVAERVAADAPERVLGLLLAGAAAGQREPEPSLADPQHVAALEAIRTEPPVDRSAIRVPTLLAWGEEDALVPRADQEALLREIPRAHLKTYPGVGHAVHREHPARFAAHVATIAAVAVAEAHAHATTLAPPTDAPLATISSR